MPDIHNQTFTIACDMDDVLMVPHTYLEFSKYLGIQKEISIPLKEYKAGNRTYDYLWKEWHRIVNGLSANKKTDAIKYVADSITDNTYLFVNNSKKLGRFIIVSNNDGDLVKAIAEKLGVDYIAVNKYIFEFVLATQRKSEAIKNLGILINAAITDDPVNESDFLNLPLNSGNGIVFRKDGVPLEFYNSYMIRYKIAGTLDEAYKLLVIIKEESEKFKKALP